MRKATLIFAALLIGVALGLTLANGTLPAASAQTAITNAEAIRICNEIVRPLSERQADMYFSALEIIGKYPAATLNTMFPANGGVIEDNRPNDSVLECNDVRRTLLFAITYKNAYEAEGVTEMMRPVVQVGRYNR